MMKPLVKTDVTLECPACRQYRVLPRSTVTDLPPEMRLIESLCPDCCCWDDDCHSERWFSAPGVEVSQDREAGR